MSNNKITSYETIIKIINKIFVNYDEKNGAQQKLDYISRATTIVNTWQKAMNNKELTTELICELHRLVCGDVYIPINDSNGGIIGFAKAGEYREIQMLSPSVLYKDSKIVHFPPKDIAISMKQLVTTMNGILASSISKELMIENILTFALELLAIHPFVNQNGRLIQVLIELLMYHLGLESLNVSDIYRHNKENILIAEEKSVINKNIHILVNEIKNIRSIKD